MKKIFIFSILFTFFVYPLLFAATQSDQQKNAATEQARQDYRAYLQQLKQLNSQYKEVMGEITKVIHEEGLPTWDTGTGDLGLSQEKTVPASGPTFGDVDLKESDNEMIVRIDLPGVEKDAIKVNIEENKMLHISGRREAGKEETKETPDMRYYKAERQRGNFERVIELPVQAKDTGIEAKYENGVLTIHIPKAAVTKKEVAVPVR